MFNFSVVAVASVYVMELVHSSLSWKHILNYVLWFLQERTLEIEYIRAVTPRKEEEPSLHDDWVSAVNGSSPR